jgi:hypothetical protein
MTMEGTKMTDEKAVGCESVSFSDDEAEEREWTVSPYQEDRMLPVSSSCSVLLPSRIGAGNPVRGIKSSSL